MTPRAKFLVLISVVLSGGSGALTLFMASDYARRELTYFREYPHRERAARRTVRDKPPAPAPRALTQAVTDSIARASLIAPSEALEMPPPGPPKIPGIIGRSPKTPLPKTGLKPPPPPKQDPLPAPRPLPPPPATSPVEDWRHAATRGYAAYNRADYRGAADHFTRALALAPDRRDVRLQLAYALKALGRNPAAAREFRAVIDQYDVDDRPFALRREVEQLENHFEVAGYVILRDKSRNSRAPGGLAPAGPDLAQSQTGLEVSYQPPRIGFHNGRRIQIYGRLLSAVARDDFALVPESHQAGIGLRWKPLTHHNLVLSAERLLKVGAFARNDWMLRAGWSRDHNGGYQPGRRAWWSHSLYLDAAVIDPADPDVYLTAQAVMGRNHRLGPAWVLQPRVTAHASWQQDSFHSAGLLEAGPGITLRGYFNDTPHEAWRSYVDLTLEYRIKLSGNSVSGSGWIASLRVHF